MMKKKFKSIKDPSANRIGFERKKTLLKEMWYNNDNNLQINHQ